MTQPTILDRIGRTALVPLRHVVPANGARILLKLESENPTGSMKDRMARAMIATASADGRLPPGGAVVEYTGGSTGVSLAMVCAAAGHPLHVVTSDAFAREKLDHMTLLGARLHVVPSDGGRMTAQLTRDMVEAARAIAGETGAYWTDQLRNLDQVGAYRALADEIWTQTGGRLDAFVQSVGTAGSLRGTAGLAMPRSASWRWSRPNRRCCRAGPREPTPSMASAPASSCRCGRTA
jgi:cysteine synthase A